MRFLLPALLLSLSCAGAQRSCEPPAPDPEIAAAGLRRAAVLEVTCLTVPGGGYGTVVLIDRDTAVTALHVVAPGRCGPGGALYEVVFPDGKRYLASVGKMIPGADLARVEAAGLKWPDPGPIEVGPAPRSGEVCTATGYPYHWWTCGGVQEPEDEPGAELRFSAPVFPGNSGSALYDAGGRLVGIVTRQVQCATTGQACGGAASKMTQERWKELMQR